jgi:hypothetical protein
MPTRKTLYPKRDPFPALDLAKDARLIAVDTVCQEPARAFRRHVKREHVHGAVEPACGDLEPPTPIPTAYGFMISRF